MVDRRWWRCGRLISRTCMLRFPHARALIIFGGLAFALLFVGVSYWQSAPKPSALPPYINKAYPRNHVPPNVNWGFVHVTFTADTTYDQASAVLSEVGGCADTNAYGDVT